MMYLADNNASELAEIKKLTAEEFLIKLDIFVKRLPKK